MKQTLYILGITICAGLIFSGCNQNETIEDNGEYANLFESAELPDSIYNKLTPGDIVIRQGNGPLSYHLMRNTEEEYSHCGIIVQEEGVWRVIHTIGGTASEDDIDGMQMIDLDEFVSHAADSMLFICHPVFDDSLEVLIPQKGYEYLERKVPFDHRFNIFSTDKIYCSELLFYIFRDIHGKSIFDIRKKHLSYMLMFSTFFHEELFEPIFHLKYDNE